MITINYTNSVGIRIMYAAAEYYGIFKTCKNDGCSGVHEQFYNIDLDLVTRMTPFSTLFYYTSMLSRIFMNIKGITADHFCLYNPRYKKSIWIVYNDFQTIGEKRKNKK